MHRWLLGLLLCLSLLLRLQVRLVRLASLGGELLVRLLALGQESLAFGRLGVGLGHLLRRRVILAGGSST